ncbi:efflux RND transporter periplasmic adaptor subunit, partial [Halochromatium sp.]
MEQSLPGRLQRSSSRRPRRGLHPLGLYQLGPHPLRAYQILVIVSALSTQPLALAEAEVLDLDQPATTIVTVTKAEPQASYPLEQVFVGRVEARRSAELGFERPGQLIEVRVREGDRVAAEALLARLDPSLLQAKRTELLADLASAEADLALAEVTANRYRSSVKDGAVTRQDLDEASEGARAASARLQLAEARIASIDLDLRKTELRAPFDGTVIRRTADEGTILSAGQPVLRVQETATPEIRIGVAGPLLEALQPDQRYNLEIDGDTVPTQLRAIIPLRVGASRTVDALFDPVGPSLKQPVEQATETSGVRTLETSVNDREAVEALPQAAIDEPARGPERPSVLRPGNLAELRLSKQVEAEGFWLPLSALSE